MLASGNTEQLDEVIEESAKLNQSLKSDLEKGRDRLLEMHSNGGDKAHEIAEKYCFY